MKAIQQNTLFRGPKKGICDARENKKPNLSTLPRSSFESLSVKRGDEIGGGVKSSGKFFSCRKRIVPVLNCKSHSNCHAGSMPDERLTQINGETNGYPAGRVKEETPELAFPNGDIVKYTDLEREALIASSFAKYEYRSERD